MPITRAPRILPIWPAVEPTAPAAADITTVSPALTRPIVIIATWAVWPGMPSAPSAVDGGATEASSLRSGSRSGLTAAYWRQPVRPSTRSPTTKFALFEATTSDTVGPYTTSPSCTLLMPVSSTSSSVNRISGSSASHSVRNSTSPAAASGTGALCSSKFSTPGSPRGCERRTTCCIIRFTSAAQAPPTCPDVRVL